MAVAAAAAAGRERATTGAIQIGIKDGTKAPQRVRGGGGSNDGIKMTCYHHKMLYHGIMYFYICTYLHIQLHIYIDKYIYKFMGDYDKHGPKIPSFHPDDFNDIQCLAWQQPPQAEDRESRPSQKPNFPFPHKTMVDIIDARKQPCLK